MSKGLDGLEETLRQSGRGLKIKDVNFGGQQKPAGHLALEVRDTSLGKARRNDDVIHSLEHLI